MGRPLTIAPAQPGARQLIDRPALAARFVEAAKRRCIIFQAPAGYGKTSAAMLLVRAWGLPTAWYSAQLWHGRSCVEQIVREVRRVRPDFGRLTVSLARSRPARSGDENELRSWSQHVGSTFADELSHLDEPLVIVLDDYDQLQGASSFFDFVIGAMSGLPPHVKVVLAGRAPPPLPLAQWILEERALVFDADDLKFGPAETEALAVSKSVAIDSTKARELCNACEGWAAGLSLSLSAGAQLFMTPDGSRPALVAYLVDQIIATLPERLTDFLDRTSVLETLNANFLANFGGISDALACMRELEGRGAMLTALVREKVYRVHPLLREALLDRIKTRRGDEGRLQLHRWAGKAFEDAGEPAAALFHFDEGCDLEGMVRVLRTRGADMLDAGQTELVMETVGKLRVRGVQAAGLFEYLSGAVLGLRGDPSASDQFAAAIAAAQSGGDDRLLFYARYGAIDLSQDRGDPVEDERLSDLIEHGRRLGAGEEADALLIAGWADAARFDFARAAELSERALAVAGPSASVARRSRIVNLLAYAQTCLGDFGGADKALSSILRELEGSDDALATCQLLILYARTALLWGDVTAVHDYASLGAELAQKLNLTSVLSMAYLYLGYARTHMGDAAGSKAAAELVRAYNQYTVYAFEKGRIYVSARQYIARSAYLNGDPEAALATIRQVLESSDDVSGFQRPIILTDAAMYAQEIGEEEAASFLDRACAAIVQAIPNHAGEAARLVDAAGIAALLLAARNDPDRPEFDHLACSPAFGKLVRARSDFQRSSRLCAAVRGLYASTAPAARAAAAEFAAAIDDMCSAGPRFTAIVAFAAAARIAHDRPALADAIRSTPPKSRDVFPKSLPALAEYEALVRSAPRSGSGKNGGASGLTKREREILVLLAQGLTNKEIAQRLVLSVRTVDAHVEHILAKLEVSSRTRAVAAAARAGLLTT